MSTPEELRAVAAARSRDLVDARVSLAGAVAALTDELEARREETTGLRDERDAAVAENAALWARVEHAEARLVQVEAELAGLRRMRLLRATGPARRLWYRIQARRR